jgi:hypothetical protein
VDPVAAGHGRFRASDADRERAIETLKVAFAQGRLNRDDLDQRAGQALLARTYAELAGATAHIPARPAPARRPRAHVRTDWPPPALAGPAVVRRRANHWAFTWVLGLATIALPVMMMAALHDRSQDLFCVSIVLLMAYVMAAVIAGANVVAARFDAAGSGRLPGPAPVGRGALLRVSRRPFQRLRPLGGEVSGRRRGGRRGSRGRRVRAGRRGLGVGPGHGPGGLRVAGTGGG